MKKVWTESESMLKFEVMRKQIVYLVTITSLFWGANFLAWKIQAQTKPFTMEQILNAIDLLNKTKGKDKKKLNAKIIADVKKRKVDFPLTEENEALLRNKGATEELIKTIRQNSPPVPNVTGDMSRNSIGMEFVKIPAGSFMMGNENGSLSEKPVHEVTITENFWMGKTEVTQGQWKAVMGTKPSFFRDCGDNCPVEFVSWENAQEFIKRLNARKGAGKYRLPTEAEWEYACRAGSKTKFSFGESEESLNEYSWFSSNSGGETHQVATKQPNDWGLYDMHGNVWEWVQDWFADYPNENLTDPTGPQKGSNRIIRGGSWSDRAADQRSSIRFRYSPLGRGNALGFRLVRIE